MGLRRSDRLRALTSLLTLVAVIVVLYATAFHVLMAREGHTPSWVTSFYWTLQVMTTLGLGDVTFQGDLGRAFSVLVLLTGVVLLFVLLPFTLIQYVYAPWLEARNAARTPRSLPPTLEGHVILTAYGPVEAALIQRLEQFAMPYVIIVADTARALALHDQGARVMVGQSDDPETYRRAGIDRASLVATTLDDMANANIALTVRECSETIPIVATATWESSVDLLKQAGCQDVIQLGELLGREMARRIGGLGGRTHIIGHLGGLVIAEVATAGTALVGKTPGESRLRERFGLNVVGVWNRGQYAPVSVDTLLTEDMTLLVSGSDEALAAYERECRPESRPPVKAVVIGGGRVGRATARNLAAAGIEYRLIERTVDNVHVTDQSRYIFGDATDPAVLAAAGIDTADSVAITPHDDDVTVYLTLLCRRLRPDMQILSRATLEQNVSTLRRAGADFVLSYVPMEANAIFDILRHGNLLLLADGLEVFTVTVPEALVGKPIADCNLRGDTGCNVLAVRPGGGIAAAPDILAPLKADDELILIGDREDELRFFERFTV
jgi:voltage-gated potassium channel